MQFATTLQFLKQLPLTYVIILLIFQLKWYQVFKELTTSREGTRFQDKESDIKSLFLRGPTLPTNCFGTITECGVRVGISRRPSGMNQNTAADGPAWRGQANQVSLPGELL